MKPARVVLGLGAVALVAVGLRDRSRIPFSTLAAQWRVGPRFFDDRGLVSSDRRVSGLTDTIDTFARADLRTEKVHPAVRAFYEDTQNHVLNVWPHWSPPFASLYRVYRILARSVGQTDLPLTAPSLGDEVDSRLIPLEGSREGLRAWIRTYRKDPERAMYIAEYATHAADGVTYMDIAFPFPAGNLASILTPAVLAAEGDATGFILTTRNISRGGHAGIWFVMHGFPIRLPLHETISVWTPGMTGVPADLAARADADTTALARHELRVFGIRYLMLDYAIAPSHGPS